MQTADSLEKSLMLGKIEGRRRRGCQRMRWLDGIIDAMNMNLGQLCEMMRDREDWHDAVYGVVKSQTRLGDWTTATRFVIPFLPRSKCLIFMTAVTIHSDLEPQGKKLCPCFTFPPSICHEVIRLDAMILIFWMLSFKTAFSLSSFTLIKRLFSFSSLSALR